MRQRKFLLIFLILSLSLLATAMKMSERQLVSKRAATTVAKIQLEPSTLTLEIGEEKEVNVYLVQTANKRRISFADIHLNYNKEILEITDFSAGPKFNLNLIDDDSGYLGKENGLAMLQVANDRSVTNPDGPSGDESLLLGTIKIKGKSAGQSPMTVVIDKDNPSQVVGVSRSADDKEIVLTLDSAQDGKYTVLGESPTSAPSGTRLSLKVKFQGVDGPPLDKNQNIKKVRIKVINQNFEKTFNGVKLTSDERGIFSGSLTLTGVPAGSGYAILVKGPQHLSRKFCLNNQTEKCLGPGKIVLTSQENSFDFSGLFLPAGDLPKDGVQDGVINAIDYSLWKSRIGSTLAKDLAVADLDFDGIVGSRDWLLMRNTLEAENEEEK